MTMRIESLGMAQRLALAGGRIQAEAFGKPRPIQEIRELVQLSDACTRLARHILESR